MTIAPAQFVRAQNDAGCGARRMTIALAPGSIGMSVRSQRELNELAGRHKFESVEPRGEEIAGMSAAQLDEMLSDINTRNLAF